MNLLKTLLISCLVSIQVNNLYAEDRALIIGINAYTKINPLEGARPDAENMYQLVQQVWGYSPQQIKTLYDGAATRQAILNAIDEWLIAGTAEGDKVIFYYSGHGSTAPDDDGDEGGDGMDETLAPVDTNPSLPNSMIRDDELNTRLKKLQGRQVIFIADSCHSGTVTRSLGNSNVKVRRYIFPNQPIIRPNSRSIGNFEQTNNVVNPLNHVIAYSAVSPTQMAMDGGPGGGVFTNAFTKGIRTQQADLNHDGQITYGELLDFTKQESQIFCKTKPCPNPLTPQLDANPKWFSASITSKDMNPPAAAGTAEMTMEVADAVVGQNNNSAKLQAQMLPSSSFRVGDSMQISINSPRKGYLFVLDIDSEGKLTILFPNEYSERHNQNGLINAGQQVTIPDASYDFDFQAQEPRGRGLLLALLIEEEQNVAQRFKQDLMADTSSQRGFNVVARTDKVQETLQKIQKRLRQTILSPDGMGSPLKWSSVDLSYQIN